MRDPLDAAGPEEQALRAEIKRLNKIIQALMNRAERSMSVQGSDFSLFQTAIVLEEQVRRRTADLERALRENEKVNRALQQARERMELEIQERKRIQEALHQSEERYRAATEAALDVVITVDENYVITFVNSAAERTFGYSVAELQGRDLATLMPSHLRSSNLEAIQDYLNRGENRLAWQGLKLPCLHNDGHEISMEFSFGEFSQEGKRFFTGVARDITERERAEKEVLALQAQLREQVIHDALTGLYNRRHLDEMFDRELVRAQRYGQSISVILIDLDYFKTINDTYGHLGGDEVLRVVGDLIKRHSRGSDIYCRYGGEEFLLVLPNMSEQQACARAEQLRLAIEATPIVFSASIIHTTASFGVAAFPQHGDTQDELFAAADIALYAAKNAGRNQVQRYVDRGAAKTA